MTAGLDDPRVRQHREGVAASEADALRERELTALWLLGRVPPELLPDGWALLRPGRAGRGPGPDVREAAFRLPSRAVIAGDVEVHLRASDFFAHGHAEDARYAGVVLHLVWEDDRALPGAPLPLPGGGEAPTVAVAPALGADPRRLRRLVARGPSGAEPCRGLAASAGLEDVVAERLRAEGRRRLAERVWAAARLVEARGWDGAWEQLLTRALRASAGRRAGREDAAALAAALTSALVAAAPAAEDGARAEATPLLAALRGSAIAGRPAPLIEALRGPVATPLVGRARAAELGWNAALPLLMAAATAYDDAALARATAALAAGWPTPRPYGRTAALRRQLLGDGRLRGALAAQGLLHVQDLWCSRGGCGVCPLSR